MKRITIYNYNGDTRRMPVKDWQYFLSDDVVFSVFDKCTGNLDKIASMRTAIVFVFYQIVTKYSDLIKLGERATQLLNEQTSEDFQDMELLLQFYEGKL